MEGRLLVYGVELPFPDPPEDWSLDATGQGPWRFGLHNLIYVSLLFHADPVPGSREDRLGRAERILRSWHDAHRTGAQPSDYSWDQHATGLRAQVIACAMNHVERQDWLVDLARLHGKRLADPAFHAGNWNHGFDQDLGLFAMGCALGRLDWIEAAEERFTGLLAKSIDEEGVTNEQAVGYQVYNYVLYSELARQLDASGRPPVPNLERRRLMPLFLAHATLPNGRYFPLGDTLYAKATAIQGTAAEYAATSGASGEPPAQRAVAYRAGFAFGRASWAAGPRYRQQPCYAIRYGPGRSIHGHRDHTALYYFTRGLPRLVESGFGGYGDVSMRKAEQLEHAHNTVVSDDAGRFLWMEETVLAIREVTEDHDYYDLRAVPYAGVRRRREILLLLSEDVVVVRDQITGASPHTYAQLWHLPEYATIDLTDDAAILRYDDGVVGAMAQLGDGGPMTTLLGERDPARGWIAYERDRRLPAPLLVRTAHGTALTFLTVFDFGNGTVAQRRGETITHPAGGRPLAVIRDDRLCR